MPSAGPTNVNAAFDMLLEEMKAHIAAADQTGAAAFQVGDYDAVTAVAARAKSMKVLMAKASALRDEWDALRASSPGASVPIKPPAPPRAPRGERLHADEFRIPLLRTLEEKGGRALKADILKRVEEILRSRLSPIEYTPIPTDPDRMRWLVRAEWVRFRLTKEGLMKNDSPRGIWEISDAGREYLTSNSGLRKQQ